MNTIYADYAATAPLHPAAAQVLTDWLHTPCPVNPSSIHSYGMDASDRLAASRQTILSAMTGDSDRWQLTFTSGGTESGALALFSLLTTATSTRRRIILSPLEHPAIREAALVFAPLFGCTVEECGVQTDGRVDLADLASRLGDDVTVVAVMTVQNETGVVQPVAECAALTHSCGGAFLTDAVQAAGHIPLPVWGERDSLPDVLTVSAHKFGGLPGVGAVLHRVPLTPLQKGGGQERGSRGGTENLPGILTMAAAASAWENDMPYLVHLGQVRKRCEEVFLCRMAFCGIPVTLAGAGGERIPTTSLFVFRDKAGETLPLGENIVLSADFAGLAISAGAACHSHVPVPSRALLAMGYTENEARRAVRLSFGRGNTAEEVEKAYGILGDVVEKLWR